MGVIDEFIKQDALAYTDNDLFGEAVTYKPASGGTRAINAFVRREHPRPSDEDPSASIHEYMTVFVMNDSTLGIAASEINLGGDSINFARRLGDTATDNSITQIESQDTGGLLLMCR